MPNLLLVDDDPHLLEVLRFALEQAGYRLRTASNGVEGLRVCDASVFPNLIAGNTNAPAMMVGWRGAEIILGGARQ